MSNDNNVKPILFTENHDEPRAVEAFGGKAPSQAAAVMTALVPKSVWMVHMGQDEGREVKIPMQVNRLPTDEIVDTELVQWYQMLLSIRNSTLFQKGKATTLDHSQLDEGIIALQVDLQGSGAIVCTNYSDHLAAGMIPVSNIQDLRLYDLATNTWMYGSKIAKPDDNGMMYIKLGPWQSQMVFYSGHGANSQSGS